MNKRRRITVVPDPAQTLITDKFQSSKSAKAAHPFESSKMQTRSNMQLQQAISSVAAYAIKPSPYRSLNRTNRLLVSAGKTVDYGSSKPTNTSKVTDFKM